jgi:GT2 family glycosyltransferase
VKRLYSIIIAGYKDTARRTLEDALRLQSTGDLVYEVIFLDNTPRSRHRVMAEHAFRMAGETCVRTVYLPHPEPGKAEAQNQGIREAKGAFLVFLDDDVRFETDLLTAFDRGFRTYDCGALQAKVELRFEAGCRVPAWLDRRHRLALAEMDFGEAIRPFEMGLTGACMAFRAELFERYGLFDERLGPGRSGTLEDQEFSERIRARGETQVYWPAAHVAHVIPPGRLTPRSLAASAYDVGHSDYFLSSHRVRGGRFKFSLYSLKQWLLHVARMGRSYLSGRTSDAVHEFCELHRVYGYWKQAMRQMALRK